MRTKGADVETYTLPVTVLPVEEYQIGVKDCGSSFWSSGRVVVITSPGWGESQGGGSSGRGATRVNIFECPANRRGSAGRHNLVKPRDVMNPYR